MFITHYQIIVVYLPLGTNVDSLQDPDDQFPQDSLGTYSDLPCGSMPPDPLAYVTAEMSRDLYMNLIDNGGLFVVGQNMDDNPNSRNDRPSLYTNGPLCYSTKYSFFVRAFAAGGISSVSL